MKTKPLWLVAVGLSVMCAWWAWTFLKTAQPQSLIGLQTGGVVMAESHLPILFWGDLNRFGDLGLRLSNKVTVDLSQAPLTETVQYNPLSYTQIQPGLWLIILNGERVFLMADPFDPEALNPAVRVDFQSDWVILQRSSLLPDDWPVPAKGWAVLGSQLSQSLEALSLEHEKPIVRPSNQGTVWLQKEPKSEWTVLVP